MPCVRIACARWLTTLTMTMIMILPYTCAFGVGNYGADLRRPESGATIDARRSVTQMIRTRLRLVAAQHKARQTETQLQSELTAALTETPKKSGSGNKQSKESSPVKDQQDNSVADSIKGTRPAANQLSQVPDEKDADESMPPADDIKVMPPIAEADDAVPMPPISDVKSEMPPPSGGTEQENAKSNEPVECKKSMFGNDCKDDDTRLKLVVLVCVGALFCVVASALFGYTVCADSRERIYVHQHDGKEQIEVYDGGKVSQDDWI